MRNKLTAVAIKNTGDGKLQDGAGLYLIKKANNGRWIFRYQLNKRRREMGLGSLDTVSLAAARKSRDKWAAMVSQGVDPIDEKRRIEDEAEKERSFSNPTFSQLTQIVFEAKKAGLRREGIAGRWTSPLDVHIIPLIGQKAVSDITVLHLKDALAPIWKKKHVTAQKALNRIRIVLRGGKRMGLNCDPDMADTAEYLLGEHIHVSEPIKATPWQEIPELFKALEGRGVAAACLQFMILTAVRSNGCRGARFSEIEGNTWTVPADRMKGRVGKTHDFAVPINQPALLIVEKMATFSEVFIFPGTATKNGISDTALAKTLNVLGEAGRPHGFRTSFRTWVQDNETATYDVAETALAHRTGNAIERSYARSDLLDQRRILMEKWAQFVTGESAAIVDLQGRAIKP
ncbi:tyrosine-type recombinase/integrase [Falsihalocynthiibacter arcticus]|uniref:tyrosine-type recombinase/integrase n=1 Tax=Falsihalocynthiibacter arcticus TaxID=1579316 RepID=UPI0030022D54